MSSSFSAILQIIILRSFFSMFYYPNGESVYHTNRHYHPGAHYQNFNRPSSSLLKDNGTR